MVGKPEVVLEWANGEYLFALRGAQIEALESECFNPESGKPGIGLAAIFTRVFGMAWYRADLMNTIRLGLVGGGMGAVEATRLVRDYAETVPLSSNTPGFGPNSPLSVAQSILAAAVIGVVAPETKEQETPEE